MEWKLNMKVCVTVKFILTENHPKKKSHENIQILVFMYKKWNFPLLILNRQTDVHMWKVWKFKLPLASPSGVQIKKHYLVPAPLKWKWTVFFFFIFYHFKLNIFDIWKHFKPLPQALENVDFFTYFYFLETTRLTDE